MTSPLRSVQAVAWVLLAVLATAGCTADAPDASSSPVADGGAPPDAADVAGGSDSPTADGEPTADSGPDTAAPADTAPPTVAFANLFNGSKLSGEVAVDVTVQDDVGVVSVTYYLNGTEVATVTTPPFGWTWQTTTYASGNWFLKAVAKDASGKLSEPAEIEVVVQNAAATCGEAPKVKLVYPTDKATVCGDLGIETAASGPCGVQKVEFFVDDKKVGEASEKPYKTPWKTGALTDGTHFVKALATDTAQQQSQQTIQVKVDNKQTQCVNPPTVFIQKPEDDAYRFGQVTIEAEASAGGDVAAIVQVLFSVDGSSIGKAEVSPWAAQWDSDKASEGPHTIKAIAKDNFDKLGVHQITVTVDRTPPSVAFAAPDSGAVVNGDAQPVTVAVDAADNLALPGVTFSAKGPGGAATDLGGVKQKPWQVLWPTTGEPSGTWTLLATATDAAGHTAQATRDVVLDRPPTLAFSDPTPGATLAGEVGVELLAQDDLGLQGSVTLRLDGTKVANLQPGSAGSGGKYLLSWLWDTTQAAFGEHLLEAEVADLSGNKATASAKVSVDQPLAVGVLVCNASFGGCKAPAGDPSTEYTGKVYLLATADDDNATVQKGELLLDGKGLQSLAAAPWQFTWDSASIKDGAHELAIKVTTSLPQSKTVAFGGRVLRLGRFSGRILVLGDRAAALRAGGQAMAATRTRPDAGLGPLQRPLRELCCVNPGFYP